MTTMLAALLLIAAVSAEPPLNPQETQWRGLIDAKEPAKAKALCGGWLSSSEKALKVEAHKCLASLAVGDGEIDPALKELEAALALAPEDLAAHEARLQIAEGARRFSELPKYLEKSLKVYPNKDGLEAWLDISAGLLDEERYDEGLAYMKVLEKKFPKDHRVIANVGTFLAAAQRRAEALPYLKRAAAMQPDDALDNWNLGKLYDELGKTELADKFYKKSLSLTAEPEQKKESYCLYAEFLKKHKKPGAAAYEKAHCPGGLPDED